MKKYIFFLFISLLFIFLAPRQALAQTVLHSIEINVPAIISLEYGKPVALSALAFDSQMRPIRTGVTYEWGLSSNGSVGIINPTNNDVTTFSPLTAGSGDLFVTATYQGQTVTKSIRVTVTTLSRSGDINNDRTVDLKDIRLLLSVFGKSEAGTIGDINTDGKVNFMDAGVMLLNFGKAI